MYNVLFGVNPLAPRLVGLVDLKVPLGGGRCWNPDGRYLVPRFRDAWLEERGGELVVVLYTRCGRYNLCWCGHEEYDREDFEGSLERLKGLPHGEGCPFPHVKALMEHPLLVRRYDDEEDPTYGYFEFRVPEDRRGEAEELLREQGRYVRPEERWRRASRALEG